MDEYISKVYKLFSLNDIGFSIIKVIFDEENEKNYFEIIEKNEFYDYYIKLLGSYKEFEKIFYKVMKYKNYSYQIIIEKLKSKFEIKFFYEKEFIYFLIVPLSNVEHIDVDNSSEKSSIFWSVDEKFYKAFLFSDNPMAIIDLNTYKYIEINDAYTYELGYLREELIDKTFFDLGIYSDDYRVDIYKKLILEDKKIINDEVELKKKDGEFKKYKFSAELFNENDGSYCILSFKVFDESYEKESVLKSNSMILSTLESLIDMGTWEYDLNSKNMKISKGSAKILGIENVSEFKREDFYKLVVSEDIQRAISYEQLFYKETFIPTLTFKIITKYNDLKYLSSKVKVIKDNFGNNIKVLGVTLDITDMKLREKKLKLFEKAIEVAGYGIYITDVDGVIEYINPAFERITGFSKKDSIGEKTSILSSGMNGDDDYYKMWNTILSGNIWKEEIVNKKKNGDFYTAYQIITPIYNEKNKIEFFVAIQEDITEQKKNQELIRKYASYDSLTDAYNRRMGLIILEKQIKNYFKNKDNISICFLDINNLKYINDFYGHNFGDIMLKIFSETIMNSINEDDYFIRLGGDEFLIIFSKSDFKKANFIWDKIKEKFKAINYEKRYPFKIEVAYGICEYNGEGLDDFISKADNLMYEKKRIMKNKE